MTARITLITLIMHYEFWMYYSCRKVQWSSRKGRFLPSLHAAAYMRQSNLVFTLLSPPPAKISSPFLNKREAFLLSPSTVVLDSVAMSAYYKRLWPCFSADACKYWKLRVAVLKREPGLYIHKERTNTKWLYICWVMKEREWLCTNRGRGDR